MDENKTEPITLVRAIRDHLMLPGEGITRFREEYAKLTDKDKAELVEAFNKQGIYVKPHEVKV